MKTDDVMIDLVAKVSKLTEQIRQLEIHFVNHLHRHWIDRSINVALFLATVVMFCFLKWA